MSNELASKIESLCKQNNVTINAMLKECGLPSSTYRNIVTGSKPSFDKVEKIADYFDVSVDYLLGRVDSPAVPEVPVALSSPQGYDNLTDEQKELIQSLIDQYNQKNRRN